MEREKEYIKLCQYMYQKGQPLVGDKEYDRLIREYEEKHGEIDKNWEDISDGEGLGLLNRFGVGATLTSEATFPIEQYVDIKEVEQSVKDRYYNFKKEKNKSMPIVTKGYMFAKVIEMLEETGAEELHASIKLDGWNVTLYIEDNRIIYAHTRGRQAEETDITSLMKAVLAPIINKIELKRGYVVGELYLESKHLEYLRDKYKKPFKTTRNSIASFINNKVVKEDMSLATFGAFKLVQEGKEFETMSQMYTELENIGFTTPKWTEVGITTKEVAQLVIDWGEVINELPPCDGVVIQPNCLKTKSEIHQLGEFSEGYEVGLYAIKMGAWGEQVYKTVVTGISLTSNTKSKRPSLTVEPIRSRDGRTINTLQVDSIGRMIDEDIYIGKEVYLKVISEKDIRLIYNQMKADMRTKMI